MGIQEFYARSEADVVTFQKGGKLRFSASLVKRLGLDTYQFARIGVDSELRRLYFSFQSAALPGFPRLYQIKNATARFIAVGRLPKLNPIAN